MSEVEVLVHAIEKLEIGKYDAINKINLPMCGYTTKLTFS